MRFSASALASVLLASSTLAVPLLPGLPNPFAPAAPTTDAPFSLSQAELDSKLSCPGADKNNLNGKKPILLVPGTGNTGGESWDFTYVPLTQQLGYTPCYVSPPPYMLNDSQTNAEYVVNAINRIYSNSGNKKVPIMTWSQGGLITQWAFTFFPSTVGKTDRFISFAGDFRGTAFAYGLDALPTGIAPTVWQQSTFSAYLTALKNAGGLQQKVPTTSIYSTTDEIVEPQEGPGIASSNLPGAKNVLVQDTCGPLFIVEHSQELFNAFTYKVAVSALQSPTGVARDQDFSSADCSEDFPAPLPADDRVKTPTILAQAAIHIIAGPRVACEPKLMPYAATYYPNPVQACNPLAFIGQSLQTPPQFNDYESLAYYVLTH